MTDTATPPAVSERSLRRVAGASLAASTLEWYDFIIYGTAAVLVFNTVFFPAVESRTGVLVALATFGVGFVFRPIGAVVFGHYGDRVGRKRLLVIAMLMMGAGTTLIGLLPGYDTIGIWAPILLVLMRCVQGVALGGQYGGAVLMVTENAPAHRRGFFGGFAHAGPSLGIILANLAFLGIVGLLPAEDFAAWGWRVPFLLSVVVIGIGLYIQLRMEDTAEFRELARRSAAQASPGPDETAAETGGRRSPVIEAVRTHPLQILQVGGMMLAVQVYYYVMSVFMLSYLGERGIDRSTVLTLILVSAGVQVTCILISGALSDRLGRKRVMLPATVAMLLSVPVFFWLAGTATVPGIAVGLLLGGAVIGMSFGPMAAFFTELFATDVRYSGASVGYQLAATIGGGFAPAIAVWLLQTTGTVASVGAYVALSALITVVSLAFAREHYTAPAKS
jgi:metabolite-proton symporter